MSRLYVVTHPEATHHVEGRVGGWSDSELTARGRAQSLLVAERIRRLVPAEAVPSVFTSDLRRTVETAAPIAGAFGVAPVPLSELREKSYGEAHGRPQAWLDERFVFPPADGERLDHDEGIPGGETKREWIARVYRGMAAVEADPAEHRIVVTHGGSATWVIAAWLRLPVEACAHLAFRTPSGSISVLADEEPFHNRELRVLGDTAHLAR